VRKALEFAESIIAKRRKLGAYAGTSDALEIERLIDAVCATTGDMHAEETRLLSQRTQRAASAQRLAMIIAIVGVFLKVGSWILAFLVIIREIDISARAQSQLNTLNAELEQRVEERTASLQLEITDRRRAQEIAERLAAVVESSSDAIISKDLNGIITAWNRGAEKVFGYSSTEALGKPLLILLPPERKNEERDILALIQRGESVEHFETIRVRKDGVHINVSVTISPIRNSGGAIVGASKITRDITERKQAEAVLAEQAQVMDLAQVFVRDIQSRVVFWPRGAEKLYGFDSKEALGIVSHDLFHTQFPEPLQAIEKKLFETGEWEGELIHRKRDGSSIIVSSAWVLHSDSQGRPVRILETNVDITARKQAAETLARQAEELASSRVALETQTLMLQSVLDGMGEGLIAADREGHFLIWNDSANKLMGRKASNLPTEQWTPHYKVFLPDAVTPCPPDRLPLVRALHGESVQVELMVEHPDRANRVCLEVTARPLKDNQGNLRGGVAVLRDITERKTAEREVQALNQNLEARVIERTAELKASNHELEAFTYSVSHDLRAPLRHISGFTKILVEEFCSSLPSEAQELLQNVEQGAHRMGQLVDQLLSLARLGRQGLAVEVTALSSLVKDVVTLLAPETEGRQVDWKIDELPLVECDPTLIRQVFQNLIGNALKYSRPRSLAVIEIGQKEKEGEKVIFVRDNGVGFDMKYADKLFGVFQRLHLAEDFEGTGIGLATVERIIRKHGGRVWAEAELEHGATFYFTLCGRGHSAPENAAAATTGSL
jgi:PAS domain S-box-containing protein